MRNVNSSAIAAIVAIASYSLLHWKGIGMTVDGWAMWQGAVSLVTGHGFTHFSGTPIIAWPPLYSAYLGLWVPVTGPTGWGLLVANGVLIALQALLWLRLTRKIAKDTDLPIPAFSLAALATFVGLFVAIHQRLVFAHNLLYVLLPVYLGVLWRLAHRPDRRITAIDLMWAITLGAAMLLTHNQAIVFLASASLIVVFARRSQPNAALATAVVISAIPLAIWLLSRHVLDQGGSHYAGWGAGRFDPLSYALQFLEGSGGMLVPDRHGGPYIAILLLLAIAIGLAANVKASGLRFGIAFVLSATALTYALFNLTWIFDPLSSFRFNLFDPLLLLPLVYVTALSVAPRLANVALLLALLPQVYWTASWAVRQQSAPLADLGFPDGFVPPSAFIDRGYREGPPMQRGGRILVSLPPSNVEARRGTECLAKEEGNLAMGADRPCR